MKRLLWALGVIALLEVAWVAYTPIVSLGQSFWPPPIISTADPVGACANGTFWVNITTPSLWYCGGSAWNDSSGGATGANTTLSNLTNPTAINDTTLTFAGAGGLTALGTNQNITLTPSGTGNTYFGGNLYKAGTTSGFLVTAAQISNYVGVTEISRATATGLKIIKQFYRNPYVLNCSGTCTIALNNGDSVWITLTGDVTSVAFTSTPAYGSAETVTLNWIQGGTAYTVSGLPSDWHGITAPGTNINSYSSQTCEWNGTLSLAVCGVANTNIP